MRKTLLSSAGNTYEASAYIKLSIEHTPRLGYSENEDAMEDCESKNKFTRISRLSYMLEAAKPLIPPSSHGMLSVVIKFLELKLALQTLKELNRTPPKTKPATPDIDTLLEFLERVRPAIDEKETQQFENLASLLRMYKMYQDCQEMASVFGIDLTPSESSGSTEENAALLSSLMEMLPPEQAATFEALKSVLFQTNK